MSKENNMASHNTQQRKSGWKSNNKAGTLIIIFLVIIVAGIGIWWFCGRSATVYASNNDGNNQKSAEIVGQSPFSLSVVLPDGMESQIVDYNGYTVSFNKSNHTPNYSAWELTRDETNGTVKRSNKFMTDRNVEGCADTRDYTRSGYDRGHLCPANDMKWSEESMNDCFNMTNMCPQDHDLNNGAWKTLETKSQVWAKRDSLLYIIAGPIYTESDKKRIGDIGVRVPSSFFKIIVAPALKNPRGIAFVYPNMVCSGNMMDYSCTIDQVEELTGYDFFPDMSPELQAKIEAVTSFKEWNKNRR